MIRGKGEIPIAIGRKDERVKEERVKEERFEEERSLEV
jgi:hypothetical protein